MKEEETFKWKEKRKRNENEGKEMEKRTSGMQRGGEGGAMRYITPRRKISLPLVYCRSLSTPSLSIR